ncbi:MAG: epoxyqueuosine reductase [Candidatus Thorarchaeota archaeon]|nr:MAG: epoxyqueuosine reductase [Candidatus Thorarchaeota archaeon]
MGIKHRFMKSVIMRFGVPRVKRMVAKQRSLQEMPGILLPTSNSPTRFEIPMEMLKMLQERDDFEMRHVFPIRRLLSVMRNIHRSVDTIEENPSTPRSALTPELLEQLQDYSRGLGISRFGFVKLPQDLIFDKFGVFYDNVIVLAMEMSKEKIDKAPSQETLNMVFGTYDELGIAANKIAAFLREQGYAAQADHPLGGLVLFPPLAQKAGIGWVGKHGILITPEFGPRVRLAAVYTNIENLPFADSNNHGWIEEYCKICGFCVNQCPPGAIMEDTVEHETGRITNILQRECFEYFGQFYGCSVCVKVCPFSKTADAYDRLKAVVERR